MPAADRDEVAEAEAAEGAEGADEAAKESGVEKRIKASVKFTAKDHVHLGLGIQLGEVYKVGDLRKRCKGMKSKLQKLEGFLRDGSKFAAVEDAEDAEGEDAEEPADEDEQVSKRPAAAAKGGKKRKAEVEAAAGEEDEEAPTEAEGQDEEASPRKRPAAAGQLGAGSGKAREVSPDHSFADRHTGSTVWLLPSHEQRTCPGGADAPWLPRLVLVICRAIAPLLTDGAACRVQQSSGIAGDAVREFDVLVEDLREVSEADSQAISELAVLAKAAADAAPS
mmetsp:Transcript_26379/g.70074  ORF Transcript_26379/g.70074 Transcript_26379/m.70074 type:complete len:280 (-) Transcript_26379:212-1051(-)